MRVVLNSTIWWIESAGRPVCFFGHTHVALRARMEDGRRIEISAPQGHPEFETMLEDGSRYLFNPGSVGQPRDGASPGRGPLSGAILRPRAQHGQEAIARDDGLP